MLSKIKRLLGLGDAKGTISKEQIAKYIPENPIILEAGASDGKDTLAFSTLYPKGKIYAFEPVPNIYGMLKERTKACKNVHTFPIALSDVSGEATMYVSSGASHGSSSLLDPKGHIDFHKNVHFKEQIKVKIKTLDEWATENGVERIDFMWLDMQGGEYKALKSGTNILKTVQGIFTEVSLLEMYEGAPLYPEFRAWLEGQGFKVAAEELLWEDMGNVLFVRA